MTLGRSLKQVVWLLTLLAVVAAAICPAAADLSRLYQSDDFDQQIQGTVKLNSTEDLAKYYDIVFVNVPKAISEQNRRFVDSFPSTDDWKSAVPKGTATKSTDVIKDAYILLVPIKGLVKVGSKYAADEKATVGYIVDYRIQLPKDKTASYPKHYYSLEKTSVSVEIRSKSVKYGASKKGTVDIYVSGDIRAVAAIKATIKEKIVEKHKVCDRTCYNINNTTICNETCTTYLTEHYNTLRYSLTVEDVLEILKPSKACLYVLYKDSVPLMYCLVPNEVASSVAGADGLHVLDGLQYVASYRAVTKAKLYKTVDKTKSGYSEIRLSEPEYIVAAAGSYDVLLVYGWIRSIDSEKRSVAIPNFKPEAEPRRIKAVCFEYSGDPVVRDFFGNPVNVERIAKKVVAPKVDVDVKEKDGTYSVKMLISYDGRPYNGPVSVSYSGSAAVLQASNGVVEFEVNASGTVNYVIPTNLPEMWYGAGETVFVDGCVGSFYVGKIHPYLLPFYQFVVLLAATAPLILLYFLMKKIFTGDEEEYI